MAFSTEWHSIITENPTAYSKEVVSNSENATTIKFTLNGYSLSQVNTENGDAFRVSTPLGASLLENGAPDLQKLSASIRIPNDAQMNTRIESADYFTVDNIDIAPSKGNLSRLVNPDEVSFTWNDSYSRDEFFPGKLSDLNTPYILREMRGLALNVYPFQYNPVQKSLKVYTEIIVSVFAHGPGEINVISNENDVIDHDFIKVYNSHFENFNTNDTRYEFVEEQGNMLIVSYGDFMDEMEPFVEWKNKKGIPTEIVNVSDIGGNSSSIEAFVDNYYYDNGLTFLLLVGDINQVPSPSVSGSASDPSYGFVEGNDSYSELFVGRFSANSPPELITQIERSIDYEQNAQAGAEWYHTTFSAGSNQGPGWGGLTDDVFLETIIDPMLLDYTYSSTTGIYDPNQSIQGGIDAINDGVSIINYTGHGWQLGWGNGSPIEVSHVENLDNAGKLPFVITVGCNVGEFNTQTNSFAESWLRATNNGEAIGGIAHVGSTISQSWEPPMHGQYGMNQLLTETAAEGVSHTIGGIVTNGCMYMNDMQGGNGINETNYWTLFGDPSIHFRSDSPSSLNATYPNSIVIGTSQLDINYTGSEVTAAFSQHGELLAYAYGNNGLASIDLSQIDLQPGEYDLVVTGYNTFAVQEVINVIAPEGAYIIHDNYELESELGNDGQFLYGQTTQISLSAENVGVDNANGVTATVSTDDMYATITDANLSFGNILANGNSDSSDSFSVELLTATPDGHLVDFDIIYSDGDNSWMGNFSIPVNAPLFVSSNPVFDDADGNGTWDAGESVTLSVNCANNGSADFVMYPGAELSTTSEYIDVGEGNPFIWYAMLAGTSDNAIFILESDADTPNGTVVSFTLDFGNSQTTNCETDCVSNHEFTFSTTIGMPFSGDAAPPTDVTATEIEDGILVEWNEPNQYDCVADAPYNDECYGYVIEIDPYCCDTAWDTLCESQYFDCTDNGGNEGYCGDGYCDYYSGEDQFSCPDDCGGGNGECDAGYVEDCSGDGDCCSEYWIGDGVGDCEDQAYGCDLTCYENDGGDCGGLLSLNNNELTYQQREFRAENPPVLVSLHTSREEVTGYNVFKDGEFLTYTSSTSHLDENVLGGSTYCYTVSALYETFQSYQSNEVCETTEGTPFQMGDVNMDDTINVLDIIVLVNMILDLQEPNFQLGDLNNDNALNVLDIILIVNIILDVRADDADDAQLLKTQHGLELKSNGFIGGIELKIKHDNNAQIQLTDDAMFANMKSNGNATHIIIVSPQSDELFTINSDFEIMDVIVANSNGEIQLNTISEFKLSQAYPNPFNPSTQFSLSLPENGHVNISVYNMLGQKVDVIHDAHLNAGKHQFSWDANELPSGIYMITSNSQKFTSSQKIMLLK